MYRLEIHKYVIFDYQCHYVTSIKVILYKLYTTVTTTTNFINFYLVNKSILVTNKLHLFVVSNFGIVKSYSNVIYINDSVYRLQSSYVYMYIRI